VGAADPPGVHLFTDLAGLPSGWNETWSTGPLPDVGDPIALSSPIPADLDGQAAVVVGDRRGFLYAYELGSGSPTGSPVPGWPTTDGSGPIDSTPSITSAGANPTVVVGSGNDADPTVGGYQAFRSSGSRLWFTAVRNPSTDDLPLTGVQAGVSVAPLGSGTDVVAGSLGQVGYALSASNGAPLSGWPFFNSDSTHSTAASADLYGTGTREIVVGGDQSAGIGRGQVYQNGGHLRILSATGNQICRADTNQVVDSSPAVGGFLAGGATGAVVGTGAYFAGASDSDTLKAYDTRCNLKWSTKVDGSTFSSPALSDVLGDGSLQVVEGTDQGANRSGSVYVLDAATGAIVWSARNIGRVIGSVVTADLGNGHDDVIAPTTNGAVVLDGRTGQSIAVLSPFLGLQNSPLVTDDPNGSIGITLAGYMASPGSPAGVGEIDHYEISGSNGGAAVAGSAWPMFHHDPQLTGDAGGTTPVGSIPPCSVPAAARSGYYLAASDGGIFAFPASGMPFCGSTGSLHLDAPMVAMAMAPITGGYWEVAADGGIFAFGQAGFYGSMGGKRLDEPVVGMAATPDGRGYWEVAADGGIFAFGDAAYFGSMGGQHLNSPVVGMSASTDGHGYRLVAADGGIFSFGDAPFSGSMGGVPLNAPVVGTTNDVNTGGYWEVAADGGIFAFGGAPFYGSTGGTPLNAAIVGQAETANGSGYRFVAADGGVFSFSAPFLGSMGGTRLNRPVVGTAGF
jgi:PQQ-like domain